MIIDGDLVVSKKKKSVLVKELDSLGFKRFNKTADAAKAGETEKVIEASEDEDTEAQDDTQDLAHAFDYLLGMAIWSLTQERVEKLRRQIGEKEHEIDELIKLSSEDIWLRDLDEFINEWRFQLSETDRRRRGQQKKGRRVSTKLATAARAVGGKKRKAAGDDSDDDFVVSKSKKKAAANKTEPAGGIMSFLKKTPKPEPAAKDSDSDSDFDFGIEEIMPKKSRGPAKASPQPKDEDGDLDMEASEVEVAPKKSRGPPKAAAKLKDEDKDEDEPKAKPVTKRGRPAKPRPKDDDSDGLDDDEFMEIAKAEAAKTAPPRAGRKAAPKYTLDDSDSDNGDDLLGDVSKMVKGIGGAAGGSATDSRQLFSELSRPGSSTGLPTNSKTSKFDNDFDADETDYSKLIPQNSPRRSLQVKPKDVKASESIDLDDEEDEPIKPTKTKAAPKAKAAPAPKAGTGKGRGRPKKDATATASSLKQTTLSPAAKAYASKQAKGASTVSKKKTLMDDSEDDIDAMANDILDSPVGIRDEAPAPPRSTATRPSRRTTTKKSYVIEDDDSEDGADNQDDSFDLSD